MTEQTHWGPDPGHGGLTQHKGSRRDCSGPDCGSDEGSHFHQATQRLDASDYQWQESGFDGGLREALVAQVHSNLAVVHELRRLNEGRDQFHETVADLLVRLAKPEPGPCPSRTPLITFDNGPLPQQSCLLRHGHEGMHESPEGSRWVDEQPAASKGFGYYAEDPSEMCTARSHPDRRAWQRCLRLAGHEGLHEDGMGNSFSKDHPKPSGSPVGSGQPAAEPDCPVCGGSLSDGDPHANAVLTRGQWRAHSEDFAKRLERVGANRLDAALWGEKTAVNHFGPCPEES